jgi:hypothetical protein
MNHRLLQLFAFLLAVVPKLSAAQLTVVPAHDVFLFAGVKGNIPITFQNESDDTIMQELTYRIYQASSATIVPLGEKAPLPQQTFPSQASVTIALPLTPPEVRAITPFILKVYLNDAEIGALNITVVPPKVFSRLKELKLKQIFLYEPAPWLRPLLDENDVEITDEPSPDVNLQIVHLPNPDAEMSWRNRASSNSVPTLFITGRGVPGAEKLLPTKSVQKNDRPTLVLQDWFIPDLQENPLSQLRLLRAIQLVCKPELELAPDSKKTNN